MRLYLTNLCRNFQRRTDLFLFFLFKSTKQFSLKKVHIREITSKEMTKPKTKPCPTCQAPNPVQVKTCTTCACSLPVRDKITKFQDNLKSKNWAQSVRKNHNSNRVVNSALISMSKLNALGYQPILFLTQKSKCGLIKGDLIHFLQPEGVNIEIIQEMQRLYELLLHNPSTASASTSSPEEGQSATQEGPSASPAPPPNDHGKLWI
ncbi:hypothetical protein NL108_013685 [Boleophthalmus pectinirostris]|uniref:uncharacterized protein LOC129412075 n=1 Tax=Boleophthalmus pectinirostris TaxID=150288 RepID=UPI00242F4890|nr:uncharacterized protein LOC129412075 [Boleophthalmus pectinirostris]KAJ0062468.1 hypothetical protein NL108_013685 [Boleophthalmus pectinirostris]